MNVVRDEEEPTTSAEPENEDEVLSRRVRLAALSSRMRKEFDQSAEATEAKDEYWLNNLHPWHKRILLKANNQNIVPEKIPHIADNFNTSSSSQMEESSFESNYVTPSTSRTTDSPMLAESISRRARLAALSNRMRKEFDASDNATDDSDSLRLSWQKKLLDKPSPQPDEIASPPPSEPPPPLPPSVELRSPPPLPPRNPTVQLPNPLETSSETTPQTKAASNSAESIVTNDGSSQRKQRGHMKTLSLDRDFALGKNIRSSPFPVPTNKSNSLTRQNVANEEEELRIIEAEGIINAITSDLQIVEKDMLHPTPSTLSPRNDQTEKPRLEKVDELKSPDSDADTPQLKIIAENTAEFSPVLPSPSEHRFHSDSSTNAPLDPITRDVERRLSMKIDRSFIREMNKSKIFPSGESISGHSSLRSTSIDHARILAKTASNYASTIFRGALSKVKQVTHAGSHSSKENDEETTDSDGEQSEAGSTSHTTNAVVRPRKSKKGPFDFQQLKIIQEMNHEHTGAVWCIKFSACGRLLATAGADCILRIWCLTTYIPHFQGMKDRYQQKMDFDSAADFQKNSNSWETFEAPSPAFNNLEQTEEEPLPMFASKPFSSYKGHTADILDLSWSKNFFILSSGMDRTAKLWHISRNECLCCFQHQDFVTSVSFLPKDDRYFVSGSLDGRIRIWNIPEKKVVFWNEVEEKLITALTFVKNGKFIVVGTYYGKCYFYTSELKYHTVISTSSRGKQSMGHKVTGLSVHGDKLLVTFNDSRIHMYDIRDKVLICKFRGAQHERSQIRASFSPDGRHVVCGSEDKYIYIWRTSDAQAARRDRNSMWERVRAHKTTATVALFAPDPQLFLSKTEKRKGPQLNTNVIASADLDGSLKIMLNYAVNKETLIKNSPLETLPETIALQDNLYRSSSVPKINF